MKYIYQIIALALVLFSSTMPMALAADSCSSNESIAGNFNLNYVIDVKGHVWLGATQYPLSSTTFQKILDPSGNSLDSIASVRKGTYSISSDVVLVRDDGTMWYTGNGLDRFIATQAIDTQGVPLAGVRQAEENYIVKTDGTVWKVSRPNTTGMVSTSQVFLDSNGTQLTNIQNIAVSETHVLALDGYGEVWAWGDNQEGQLGTGDLLTRDFPNKVMAETSGASLQNIVQVDAAGPLSLAVDFQGRVYRWGRQVEFTGTEIVTEFNTIPSLIEQEAGVPFSGISQVVAGAYSEGYILVDEFGFIYISSMISASAAGGPLPTEDNSLSNPYPEGYPYPSRLKNTFGGGMVQNSLLAVSGDIEDMSYLDASGNLWVNEGKYNGSLLYREMKNVMQFDIQPCTTSPFLKTVDDPSLQSRLGLFPEPDPSVNYKTATVITHGWNSDADSWVRWGMAESICELMGAVDSEFPTNRNGMTQICEINGNYVWIIDWRDYADTIPGIAVSKTPSWARKNAKFLGVSFGYDLAHYGFEHVHLIGHSAGSQLIDSMSKVIKTNSNDSTSIHLTFLDAYHEGSRTAKNLKGRVGRNNPEGLGVSPYGLFANWVDNYYDTRIWSPTGLGLGTDNTKNLSTKGFSFDVTALDDNRVGSPIRTHAWPYEFYIGTVGNSIEQSGYDFSYLSRSKFGKTSVHPLLKASTSSDRGMINCILGSNENPGTDCQLTDGQLWVTRDADNQIKDEAKDVRWENRRKAVNGIFNATYSAVKDSVESIDIGLSVVSGATTDLSRVTPQDRAEEINKVSITWGEIVATSDEPVDSFSLDLEFISGSTGLLTLYLNGEVVGQVDQKALGAIQSLSVNSVPAIAVPSGDDIVIGIRLENHQGENSFVQIDNFRLQRQMNYPAKLLNNGDWELLSLPAFVESSATVRNLIANKLPAEGYGDLWAIFAYDPITNSYEDVGIDGELSLGKAYWVIQFTGEDIEIFLPNESMEAVVEEIDECSGTRCASVPLLATTRDVTWNMVGYPFSATQPFDAIKITSGSAACSDGCDLATAKVEDLVHDQMWSYNSALNVYDVVESGSELQPWIGLWAAVLPGAETANVELKIPER